MKLELGGVFAATFLVSVAFGGGPVGASSVEPTGPGPASADGQEIYNSYCIACHQPGGEGAEEVFPPLAGSEWVTGAKDRLLRILLHGLTGPIMVAGTEYNGAMPAFSQILDDEQLAAVATYIRTTWGNSASSVTAGEVAVIRAASGERTTPWTARELAAAASASAGER